MPNDHFLPPGAHHLNFTCKITRGTDLAGAFCPTRDTENLGVSVLGAHVEGKPSPGSFLDRCHAEVWVMIHDPDRVDAIMASAGAASRDPGWDLLRAISHDAGMPLADVIADGNVRIISGYSDHHEHGFAALDEGEFEVSVKFRLNTDDWEEITGRPFDLDGFRDFMMPPAFAHPEQVGLRLLDVTMAPGARGHRVIKMRGEVTDGLAAGAAVCTLMRANGYGDDDAPADPGQALAEVWMMSNDAPTPMYVGVEYVSQKYLPGAAMRPARKIPEPVSGSPEP